MALNFTLSPDNWFYTTPGASTFSSAGNAATASTFKTMGPIMAMAGAAQSVIGSYYAAKSQEYQLESQSENLKFQKEISLINAQQSEFTAQTMLESGQRKIGAMTLRAGNIQGAARASMAARGGQIGVGSNADIISTTELMKQIDSLTLNAESVRAAESARIQGTNYRTQAAMQGISANNLMTSAGTISPFGAGLTSLIGSASNVANAMYYDKQSAALEKLIARGG